MDEISADELYEGLLAYVFFLEKLPPIFTAVPFFDYCKTITTPFEVGWNEFITFRASKTTKYGSYGIRKIEMGRYWLFCYEVLTWGSIPGKWRVMKQVGIYFIRKEIIDGTSKTNTKSNRTDSSNNG